MATMSIKLRKLMLGDFGQLLNSQLFCGNSFFISDIFVSLFLKLQKKKSDDFNYFYFILKEK